VVNLCSSAPVRKYHLIVNIPHSPCDYKGPLPLGEDFKAGRRKQYKYPFSRCELSQLCSSVVQLLLMLLGLEQILT